MVWNNNQQMHGAPGKISPSVFEEEDLPRFHHDSAIFHFTKGHEAEIQKTYTGIWSVHD